MGELGTPKHLLAMSTVNTVEEVDFVITNYAVFLV